MVPIFMYYFTPPSVRYALKKSIKLFYVTIYVYIIKKICACCENSVQSINIRQKHYNVTVQTTSNISLFDFSLKNSVEHLNLIDIYQT